MVVLCNIFGYEHAGTNYDRGALVKIMLGDEQAGTNYDRGALVKIMLGDEQAGTNYVMVISIGTWIVVLGRYSYMADLRTLESKVSPRPCSPQLAQVNTPLRAGKWESMLQDHPDQEFAQYLVKGIKEGFGTQSNAAAPSKTCSLPSSTRP